MAVRIPSAPGFRAKAGGYISELPALIAVALFVGAALVWLEALA